MTTSDLARRRGFTAEKLNQQSLARDGCLG